MSAIAGIDQALWDIKGKFYNAPVHQLLGGKSRESIKVYSWIGGDRPHLLGSEADVLRPVSANPGIDLDRFPALPSEQLMHGRIVKLALNVPKRLIDSSCTEADFIGADPF